MLMNTHDQYGLIARLLHWLIAVLAIGMLAGGGLLSILPAGGVKAFVIAGHKSIGVLIMSADDRPHRLAASPIQNPATWATSRC